MFYEQFKITKKIVEKILRDYPETRNSDRKLYLVIFEKLGLKLTDEQRAIFLKLPIIFETISRARRKIQNEEKKYQPDQQIKKQRRYEAYKTSQEILPEEEKERQFTELYLS